MYGSNEPIVMRGLCRPQAADSESSVGALRAICGKEKEPIDRFVELTLDGVGPAANLVSSRDLAGRGRPLAPARRRHLPLVTLTRAA